MSRERHAVEFCISEWSWISGRRYSFLILRYGPLRIAGMRADFGMNTESALHHRVPNEAGLISEDTASLSKWRMPITGCRFLFRNIPQNGLSYSNRFLRRSHHE